jgi:DNA-binding HxlR family transcriptional regulator
MNHHRRALAGSSRALDAHGATVESGVILALTGGNTRKDFGQLLRELAPARQASLAAALVSLVTDGWIARNEHNGRFGLTSRGLDMVDAAKRKQRGGQARRSRGPATNQTTARNFIT